MGLKLAQLLFARVSDRRGARHAFAQIGAAAVLGALLLAGCTEPADPGLTEESPPAAPPIAPPELVLIRSDGGPATLEVRASGGTSATFELTNEGDSTLRPRLRASEASGLLRVSLDAPHEIGPGETFVVRLRVEVPPGTAPGRYLVSILRDDLGALLDRLEIDVPTQPADAGSSVDNGGETAPTRGTTTPAAEGAPDDAPPLEGPVDARPPAPTAVATAAPGTTAAASTRTSDPPPIPPAAALAITGTLAGGALFVIALRFEWFRFAAAALLSPLYSRLKKASLLDQPTRERVHAVVAHAPGISFVEILRVTGLASGVAFHHLRMLEKHGAVASRREGTRRRFYPVGARLPPADPLSAARARILGFVERAGGATQGELASALGLTQQGVSYHLKALERTGHVIVRLRARRKVWVRLHALQPIVPRKREDAHKGRF